MSDLSKFKKIQDTVKIGSYEEVDNVELSTITKNAADKNTPSIQVYLIGWGGIYYPAGSLHEKAFNEDEVRRIVPGRGSDIWFWAAALANNTNQICLGMPEDYNLGIPIPQNDKTKPKDRPKTDVLLERFQMAIDYFEVREKLIKLLPNK